jgi:predicted dehydrogenase
MSQHSMSRRHFLKRTGAMAAGAAVFPLILSSRTWASPPSERLTLGCVGVGKMMGGHIEEFQERGDVQILALCDVESRRLEIGRCLVEKAYAARLGKGTYTAISTTKDFREIAARTDIDAAIVATPDHWHTLVSLAMIRSGKDVYCEKPLTLTINEGKALVSAVRRYGRVFQTGSQQRSEGCFRIACELVRNGRIGKVHTVHVSVGGPSVECSLPPEAVPDGLDWDRWLGPAPWRPYNAELAPSLKPGPIDNWDVFNERIGPYPNFRGYRDYSGGGMTDWGAHHFDIAQWGLGMDGSGPVEAIPPNGNDMEFLTYRYANGVVMQRRPADRAGIVFLGTEGKVMVNRGYLETEPAGIINASPGPNEVHLYQSPGHHDDWLRAIRTRNKPICDVEIGHRSVSVCHLGNIASWLNRPVRWDPVHETFIDDEEANRMLQRPMRSPWRLA